MTQDWRQVLTFFFSFPRFFIAEKAVGAKGFKAIWTEIKDPMDCSNGFQCFTSKYCISEALKCNSIDNCGKNDRSDEVDCKCCFSYAQPNVHNENLRTPIAILNLRVWTYLSISYSQMLSTFHM